MKEAQHGQGPGCSGSLEQHLNCRYDQRLARFFQWNQVPSLVMMVFGSALAGHITGVWWPLIALLVGAVALWGLGIETRLLCTHCPFYGAEGRTLHCLALDGWPKFWRYRPGPMNGWEKAGLAALFLGLEALPLGAEAYAAWFIRASWLGSYTFWGMAGVFLATLLTEGQFLYIIRQDFCARCINFSCPLNTVAKGVRDAYLAQHPALREAWEKSGYRF